MSEPDVDTPMGLPGLRPHAKTMFRGGIAIGLGSFVAMLALLRMLPDPYGTPVMGVTTLVGTGSALAMLLGALRMPPAYPVGLPAAPDESPSEAFLRVAVRAESWIARARQYLLVGGLLGAIAWVPLMLFGLTVTARGEGVVQMRILSLAGLVAFGAIGILWWRRLRDVDRELREWRLRVQKLRAIEADLLA